MSDTVETRPTLASLSKRLDDFEAKLEAEFRYMRADIVALSGSADATARVVAAKFPNDLEAPHCHAAPEPEAPEVGE